jgi:hypothetical protein
VITKTASEGNDDRSVDSPAPQPMPRGVASPDGKTAFISGFDDSIQSINLETGELLWSIRLSGEPIVADHHMVVVAREPSSSVVELDEVSAEFGSKLGSCRIQFPFDIDVSKRARFRLFPKLVDNRVVVRWQASDRYMGGAPPPKFIEEGQAQESRGTFECDFRDVQVEAVQVETSASPPAQTSWAYRSGGVWRETAWVLGETQATLEMDYSNPDPVLVLNTVDSKHFVHRSPLVTGQSVEPTLTEDGRYLFVRRTDPPGESWEVWEVATHKNVGRIAHDPGSDLPAVLAGRVYYLAPTPTSTGITYRLKAVDLHSGQFLWEHELGGPAQLESAPPLPKLR